MDWFLENAYLIPGVLVLSFFLILFFGKRMPRKGSEIGVGAIAIAFALSCGAAVAWVDRPADVKPESTAHAAEEGGHAEEPAAAEDHAEEEAASTDEHAEGDPNVEVTEEGVSSGAEGEEHAEEAVRRPVERSFTWWESGSIKIGGGILVDGLAVMMLFVVTAVSLAVHIYSTSYMEGDRR